MSIALYLSPPPINGMHGAEQATDEDHHGGDSLLSSIMYSSAGGVGVLDLRGGGADDREADEAFPLRGVARPLVPGGGVWHWLLDEDGVEEAEHAELERRRLEVIIAADADAAAADGDGCRSSMMGEVKSMNPEGKLIVGQRDGKDVLV